MKYRVMKQWVKALRSGEYKQGQYTLCNNNTFCCLGVLADLAAKENICKTEKVSYCSVTYDTLSGTLPPSVLEWSGIKNEYGVRKGRKTSLVGLNDKSGYSFKRIADIIEKEYKDL